MYNNKFELYIIIMNIYNIMFKGGPNNMYIYISERKNSIVCHASNNKKYIDEKAYGWSINKKNNSIFKYYIDQYNSILKSTRIQFVLLYKNDLKSDQYKVIAIGTERSILRGIGKRKKTSEGMYNFPHCSYRVIMLTDNYIEPDIPEDIIEEKPERRFILKSQSDGSYQLWYNSELIASCDDYSEVREVLDEENAHL